MNHTPDILLLCVGTPKEQHLAALIADFEKRLSHEARFQVITVKDSGKAHEGIRLGELLDKFDGESIALGEEGTQYSSRALATLISATHQKLIFIIGGPDGLDNSIKNRSSRLLSLSAGTFTHEMARLFLTEQLYRACTILHNRKYHRD